MPTRQPTPPPSPPKPRRRAHALDEPSNPAARRVGLVGTVAIHVLLVVVLWNLPKDFLGGDSMLPAADANRAFEIELSPELNNQTELEEILKEVAKAPPPEPDLTEENAVKSFVPINPEAPVNFPDRTSFISRQDQQAAQPDESTLANSPFPYVRNDDLDPGNAIITGSLFQQRASLADQFEGVFEKKQEEAAPSEASPDPKLQTEARRGTASEGEPARSLDATATPEGIGGQGNNAKSEQGVEEGSVTGQGYFARSPRIDRTRPMQRPRIMSDNIPEAAPTILMDNDRGASRVGVIAADARWTEFGDYYARMWDSIALEWEKNLMNTRMLPAPRTRVNVKIVLNRKGEVTEILEVSGDATLTAEYLCVAAITNRAPFGEWTPSMVRIFGEKTEMTFGFRF